MSELFVIGLNHRTAPVDLREQLAVDGSELKALIRDWRHGPCQEGAILATCNRVEFYGHVTDVGAAEVHAQELLNRRAQASELSGSLYTHAGPDAIRHMFRVASSLDSLVVGEPQILGQVKDAFEAARVEGAVGTLLGRALTRAFAVAKRVRSETAIAEGTVSVSSIATALARKIFGDLMGRRVLLIGAGEMGEAAAKSLSNTGATLRVVNRSTEKAQAVAATCGGEAREYEALADELVKADVVITTTASKRPILTEELMRGVTKARRHRPLFLIDIAVPRDVDRRVGELNNIFLYDVDDLQQVADENLAHRRKAAEAAERIIDVEVAEFESWRRSLDLTPTIVGLRERFMDVVAAEIDRAKSRMALSPQDEKALERMQNALVNKLLHDPLTALKAESDTALISSTRRLFALDSQEESGEGAKAEAEAGRRGVEVGKLAKERG